MEQIKPGMLILTSDQNPSKDKLVILITVKDKFGIVGLILNQPKNEENKFYGGTDDPEDEFVIHPFEKIGDLVLAKGVALNGFPELIRAALEMDPSATVRYYEGCTKWRIGELEKQFYRKMWVVCSTKTLAAIVYHKQPEKLYSGMREKAKNNFLPYRYTEEILYDFGEDFQPFKASIGLEDYHLN